MKHKLREDLPPLPDRIAALPVAENGYPVPWFVAWDKGKPVFPAADGEKLRRAVKEKLCWVCGEPLTVRKAFVIGPMCAVNRISAEPPCHVECAVFSVRACPFLTRPHAKRREVEGSRPPAGIMIYRNPGASAVWETVNHLVEHLGRGKVLFKIGDPLAVTWWAEGRAATRDEVLASIDSGLPLLREMCETPAEFAELDSMIPAALALVPA